MKKSKENNGKNVSRRDFIAKSTIAGASLAAGQFMWAADSLDSNNTKMESNNPEKPMMSLGTRKLGSLEVSSVGLGVQNMSRKYETTIPYRPEMINIIRSAFDNGITFYDSAEAYGPHEVERILGEGVAPFRDKVKIAT
jgi:hypothetical protein